MPTDIEPFLPKEKPVYPPKQRDSRKKIDEYGSCRGIVMVMLSISLGFYTHKVEIGFIVFSVLVLLDGWITMAFDYTEKP